jgi:hypothetical protein
MDIPRIRLASQHLSGGTFDTAEEVVRWMGAMQAQDYGQALWAIASRMKHGTIADVEKAIADHKILRTWPMRGTIHFIPAEDTDWMLKLTGVRMLAADGRRQRQLDITPDIIATCADLLKKKLKGGKRLSRPEIMELLESNGISTAAQRGYHILYALALSGMICMGPLAGKQQTFVLLDEWVPKPRQLTADEGLGTFAKRYIQSHGPATVRDFATWTKLTLTESRKAFSLAEGVESKTINGIEYWVSANVSAPKAAKAYLLAAFDEYFIGYKDRDAVIDPAHKDKVVPGGNGVFKPTLIVDGQIAGVWQKTIKKDTVEIKITPFWPLEIDIGALQKAAEPFASFIGKSATIEVLPIA